MTDTKLTDVSVQMYLNQGPHIDDIDPGQIFSQFLGTPMGMEIHSSINSMYRYGWVLFDDRVGIRETLPLTGNEILTIRYSNPMRPNREESSDKVIHFNIYDIEEVTANPDDKELRFSNKYIRIHLIECPFFLKYNTESWNLSWGQNTGEQSAYIKGVKIDDIFRSHLLNELKLNEELFTLNFDKMSTEMHFLSPSWKSQMIFDYLLKYAKDENNYGNVKFYTTSDVENNKINLNLKSVNSMYLSKTPAHEYMVVDAQPFSKSIENKQLLGGKNLNQILSFSFKSYDISTLPSGFAGGQAFGLDYNNTQYYTLYDNYEETNNKSSRYFSSFALWSNKIKNKKSKSFNILLQPKDLSLTYLNNQITEHQHQLRCMVTTYINERVEVGDKILILFPSGIAAAVGDYNHLLDEQMSGIWLVEDCVDSSMNGQGVRNMTLMKDSFVNMYEASTQNRKVSVAEVKSVLEDN